MQLTLRQAAKETGLTKPAILKAIQKGKVSAEKNENGHWRIEPVELFRVYPKDKPVNEGNDNQLTTGNAKVNSSLQVEVKVLRERIEDKNEIIEDLRKERNDWKKQAQTLLLQKPTFDIEKLKETQEIKANDKQTYKTPEKPIESNKSFWGRLFSLKE